MKTPLRGVGPPGDNEVFGLIMGDNHRYAMWDAAYVLGSLSSVDRREFEGHMAHCPACREAVAELSGVPALLSQLDRDEVTAITQSDDIPMATPEMSPELLPSLLAKVLLTAAKPVRSMVSPKVKPTMAPDRAVVAPASVHAAPASKSIVLKWVKLVAVRVPAPAAEASSKVLLPPDWPPLTAPMNTAPGSTISRSPLLSATANSL